MKSTKTNKGITLIALIITIVVLLILAAVAISSIQNDGILHYAQNAADNWNKAQINEVGVLDGYLDVLDKYSGYDKELDLVQRYFLGANKDGRSLFEILNLSDDKFIGEETTIPDADVTMGMGNITPNESLTEIYIPISYNGGIYKVACDIVFNATNDDVEDLLTKSVTFVNKLISARMVSPKAVYEFGDSLLVEATFVNDFDDTYTPPSPEVKIGNSNYLGIGENPSEISGNVVTWMHVFDGDAVGDISLKLMNLEIETYGARAQSYYPDY